MSTVAIADTGVLFAYLSRRDAHHLWAVACFQRYAAPLITCEAVLTETMFLLRWTGGDVHKVVEMLGTGMLTLGLSVEDGADRIGVLVERYRDRISLADACVIRLSELYAGADVLTTDVTDFNIYRRNGRSAIPLVVPAGMRPRSE